MSRRVKVYIANAIQAWVGIILEDQGLLSQETLWAVLGYLGITSYTVKEKTETGELPHPEPIIKKVKSRTDQLLIQKLEESNEELRKRLHDAYVRNREEPEELSDLSSELPSAKRVSIEPSKNWPGRRKGGYSSLDLDKTIAHHERP